MNLHPVAPPAGPGVRRRASRVSRPGLRGLILRLAGAGLPAAAVAVAGAAPVPASASGPAPPFAVSDPVADPEFERLLQTGFPCLHGDAAAHRPVSGVAEADRARRAPAVSRDADTDLVTIRWTGIVADPVSGEIPILVEDGTVGLMIRAQAPDDRFYVSVELIGPDGEVLACETCGDGPAVGQVRAGRGATQMPSTDRPGWELSPGAYSYRVSVRPAILGLDETGTTVDVVATLRSDAAPEVRRFLDLNFIYLPGSGLDREFAPTAPEFIEMMDRVADYLAPAGLEIGRITHKNLNRRGFSRISTWDQVGRLFRSSARLGEPRAINVYCVEGFEAPLNPAVGLSGGIPGPVTNGTTDSGVIIRTSPLFTCSSCIDAFASLFAHEFGHYLGLYHTTEANLRSEDPFSDTPRCTNRDLRECPDWPYVMFPVIHPANTVWSPGQIEVVRSHPMVYTAPVLRPQVLAETPAAPEASPNPFRETVDIRLQSVGNQTPVRALVYDVGGRKIRDLGVGDTRFSWDGRDERGAVVPGGVYFARIIGTDEAPRTLRIVKLR